MDTEREIADSLARGHGVRRRKGEGDRELIARVGALDIGTPDTIKPAFVRCHECLATGECQQERIPATPAPDGSFGDCPYEGMRATDECWFADWHEVDGVQTYFPPGRTLAHQQMIDNGAPPLFDIQARATIATEVIVPGRGERL